MPNAHDWQPKGYKDFARIVADAELPGGKPAIRGTRQSVALILECLANGMTLDDIGDAFGGVFYTRGAFSKLLVVLASAWREQTPHGATFDFRPEVWSALGAIDSLIKEGGAFRVEQFARRAGLTPNSFTRVFGAATGLAPSDYFQKRRAQHAAHLLLSSSLTVGEIAHRLGYADNAHLTRHFLKTQGLGPRAFRRRYDLHTSD